jgi:hypothetical protein
MDSTQTCTILRTFSALSMEEVLVTIGVKVLRREKEFKKKSLT